MAKVVAWIEKIIAVVVSILGVVIGARAALRRPDAPSTQDLDAARADQKAQDAQAAQDAARHMAVVAEEKRQADIQAQKASVDARLAQETQRIEGLDRNAVAAELRSLDTSSASSPTSPAASPPSPASTPDPTKPSGSNPAG